MSMREAVPTVSPTIPVWKLRRWAVRRAYTPARYATEGHDFEANVRLLLHNLEGVSDRRARFRTVVALILDGQEYTFEGIVNGTIAESPRGGEGFGYDPVFIPDGYAETFAQMPAGLKNAISHRAIAVRRFAEFMQERREA